MQELIKLLLKEKDLDKNKVERIKLKWAGRHQIMTPLSSDILNACTPEEREKLKRVLVTKPTRTLSGVAVVAVMTKPAPCPGKCSYCPRGENAPQSYTGYEPAARRAILNKYDPFKQVRNRLTQLNNVGHVTDKCELIIMGGTFPAQPLRYKRWFVKRCFDAFNNQSSKSLINAQKLNETAKNRVVGLTIETRPDWVFPEQFLKLGCTRVELGVQSVYDNVLKKIHRGHTVEDTANAIKLLKDNCFKVLLHIMPGLPGSSYKKDLEMFKTLFTDERFKPDALKIYPTLIIKGTKLYNDWITGKYKPIDEVYMKKLLTEVFKMCPKFLRIHRVQRDIPSEYIEAGPKQSNLRELITKDLTSNEIRLREAGHVYQRSGKRPENVQILVKKYKASGGDEYFISAEDKKQDILVGFCRLRITVRKEALVRELHIYGETLPLGGKGKLQHEGWGKKLLAKAEDIAKDCDKKRIIVISGVGVRAYYKRFGYKLDGAYMIKTL